MTEESDRIDPYDAVLAVLRAQRDEIDKAIKLIDAIRGAALAAAAPRDSLMTTGGGPNEGRGAFLGMSIVDATKKLLSTRKEALSNEEIAAALRAGGIVMESGDQVETVGSILGRRFDQVADIVRVGRGTWGLAEWYPDRSPDRAKDENGDGDVREDDDPNSSDALGEFLR